MRNDLTNLLPPERQKALSHDYFLRLGVVVAVLVTLLSLASMSLLIPAYVLLTDSARAKAESLANIESSFSSTSGTALSVRLAALDSSTAALSALALAPSASALIRSVLGISHPGVTLTALSYKPAEAKTSGTLLITGTALTRDALRTYQLSVESAHLALSAALPVSAFAKDSNIPFTITVTLAP